MSLKKKLDEDVQKTFREQWEVQVTSSVPAAEDLRLNSNHAKDLETATVLYADLNGSTKMVDQYDWRFSAEVYKTFLRCAADIIRAEGGAITAYDGDRIMGIFTGETKNTTAVRCALKITFAVREIIQPALKNQYQGNDFTVGHIVGIDTSRLRTARTGVRGDNDLVWIGRAANYAAKLTSVPGKTIWITNTVYDAMNDTVKYSNGQNMWAQHTWNDMDNVTIYGSTYQWRID
ncbi:adenylate/guanylate cyclase domain-containing protein [Duganella aceris]|uniref:Adenylate/guanylate cyclase domain-containing protein n=1 Tax=Duganella aceris TaxID=2703883 RepID=A0ABX0FVZ1_9BURK|nr:adenylate/guanylate cyclase domain-containing protein [Duganella aceris]